MSIFFEAAKIAKYYKGGKLKDEKEVKVTLKLKKI